MTRCPASVLLRRTVSVRAMKSTSRQRRPFSSQERMVVLSARVGPVECLEHRHQLSYAQHINKTWLEVRQLDVPSSLLRRDQQFDQNTQPDAVDVSHSTEIEDDLFALGQQVFHHMAEVGTLIAKYDSATALDDCGVRNGPCSHLKSHVVDGAATSQGFLLSDLPLSIQ
jgi:hypothetical protein